jgi:hypothetical protein
MSAMDDDGGAGAMLRALRRDAVEPEPEPELAMVRDHYEKSVHCCPIPPETAKLFERPGGYLPHEEVGRLEQTEELLGLRLVSKSFNNAIVNNRTLEESAKFREQERERVAGVYGARDSRDILKMFGLSETGEFTKVDGIEEDPGEGEVNMPGAFGIFHFGQPAFPPDPDPADVAKAKDPAYMRLSPMQIYKQQLDELIAARSAADAHERLAARRATPTSPAFADAAKSYAVDSEFEPVD